MTPASLSFVKNVAFPFVRAWSGFEPGQKNHPELRHLAEEVYSPAAAKSLPAISKDILNDYNRLLRDLKVILKREAEPLYAGHYRRVWYQTATKIVDELVQLSLDIGEKARTVHDDNSHHAFQISVRNFTNGIEEAQSKYWQMEIGIRVALGINDGEEESFFNPDPDASASS